MLAQLLCELSLLSSACAAYPSSLISSCALCLALSTLRCGLWRDGSPGPSTSPEQYWTASMAQVTGYERDDLREGECSNASVRRHGTPLTFRATPADPGTQPLRLLPRFRCSRPHACLTLLAYLALLPAMRPPRLPRTPTCHDRALAPRTPPRAHAREWPADDRQRRLTLTLAANEDCSRLATPPCASALQQLLALYEHASPEISASPMPGSPEETAVYGIIRHKFSQPRFLNVHMVAPFTPHAGGALSSPAISAFDHSML